MALIKCPECGNEISDTAEQCIHCGYKIKKDENNSDKSDKVIIIIRRNRSVSYARSIISIVIAIAFFLSGLRCLITSNIIGWIIAWTICFIGIVAFIFLLVEVGRNNSSKSEILTENGDKYYAYNTKGERIILMKEEMHKIKFSKIGEMIVDNKNFGFIIKEDEIKLQEELTHLSK